MKGIVLAGGTGSRLAPLTRITNKHLLPIYDKPMVSYAIEALVTAGLSEIMLITGGTHAGEFLRLLGSGHDHGVDRLMYAYQEQAGGIAEALGLAERFADGEPVVVMLADNIFERSIRAVVENYTTQGGGARILLSHVEERAHLCHLGVPRFEGERVVEIIEKPADPPSDYAVTGVYVYDGGVFDRIKQLTPSQRGELEITDVNNLYIKSGTMQSEVQPGFWGDAGDSINAYYLVNDYVREHGANRA